MYLLEEKEIARGSSVDVPVLDRLRLVRPEKLDERPAATVLSHLRKHRQYYTTIKAQRYLPYLALFSVSMQRTLIGSRESGICFTSRFSARSCNGLSSPKASTNSCADFPGFFQRVHAMDYHHPISASGNSSLVRVNYWAIKSVCWINGINAD